MQPLAALRIRGASGPWNGDGNLPGATAREHVDVVIVSGSGVREWAFREDVGAGRDLAGRVRRVGNVVKGPAFAFVAEILPEELVVVGGEFPDRVLQDFDRVDGAGPTVNFGIRAGLPAGPERKRPPLGHQPDVVRLHRQRQIEAVHVGDVVIDQRDQLIVGNLVVAFRRDLRIGQVVVVANRPLRKLILAVDSDTLVRAPIPHHDAVRDLATNRCLGIGDGAHRVAIVSQRIRASRRGRQILAVGPDEDAAAIPENQRKLHENALAGFQAEVVFAALLVADVAPVILEGQIVGVIRAIVRIPHDGVNGLRGVVGDSESLQRHGVAIRVLAIRQNPPG